VTEKIPATGFVVGTAFLFGAGYAALVLLGLGAIAVTANTDNPVPAVAGGLAPVALVISGLAATVGMITHGLRRDNRIRLVPVLVVAAFTLAAYMAALALILLTGGDWDAQAYGPRLVTAVLAPASIVVLVSAAAAAWAYVGTLRWQARNAETKQFGHPED
jgi:hypothetical protein